MPSSTLLEPIAIIGIGCRFPGGSDDPKSYWSLLESGKDAIKETPEDRWSLQKFYSAGNTKPGKTQCKWGGYVEDIEQFDPQLFGISPREAASMDPQQRMLLEVTWRALEDGGAPIEKVAGQQVAVFVGISSIDYSVAGLSYQDRGIIHPYSNTGGSSSIAANRISYCFDLRGPSVAVDTACSSSLVAVHMACESIWHGDCSMALAGGVNALLLPDFYVAFSQLGVLSPDGRCKAFDARANGYVRSEGAGMIFLKRLSQAQSDGDSIYAVIRATGLNQDGRTPGLTVPSQTAQEALLRATCERAKIAPCDIQYVEAHGTGTSVGDPIEANALGAVLGKDRARDKPCWIGSVKTNIGHLEAGAGIASVIKVALALKHKKIPAHLHYQRPNPAIDFEQLNLRIPQETHVWDAQGKGRIAGVNGFGYGGANGHVILEEAPEKISNKVLLPDNGLDADHQSSQSISTSSGNHSLLLPISARTTQGIRSVAKSIADWMEGLPEGISLQEIASYLTHRRSHLEHRGFVQCDDRSSAIEALKRIADPEQGTEFRLLPSHRREQGLAFVCSGQGPQWWGMGRPLLTQSKVFRKTIAACEIEFLKYGSWSLLEELQRDERSSRMNQTSIAQPSIFAIQVALASIWADHGILPTTIVGHSVGEIAAAYLSGGLSFEDACRVAFHRGRTMDLASSKGGMLAVGLSTEELSKWIDEDSDEISIAAINGPTSITLSGHVDSIEVLEKKLLGAGIFARRLAVEYAFHSAQMDPVREELLRSLARIKPKSTDIPMISTVTGRAIDGEQLDAQYWWKNVRQSVRFADAMRVLAESGKSTIVEIGPHPVLSFAVTESFQAYKETPHVLPSLHRDKNDLHCIQQSMGELYSLGFDIPWSRIHPSPRLHLEAPLYPFQKQRCWCESRESRLTRLENNVHPLMGESTHGPSKEWHGRIDLRVQNYLTDHRVRGVCVLPAAAAIEMGFAAARQIQPDQSWTLERVRLHNPCILADDQSQWLRVSHRLDRRLLEMSFRNCEEDIWSSYATVGLSSEPLVEEPEHESTQSIQSRCNEYFDSDRCYEYCAHIGLEYGPRFRGVREGWRCSGESLVHVSFDEEPIEEDSAYCVHPALLDACFHAMIAADGDFHAKPRSLYLPVEIKRVRYFKKPPQQLLVHVRLHYKNGKHMLADIAVMGRDGGLCISLEGFLSQRVLGGRTDETLSDWSYNYYWEETAPTDQTQSSTTKSIPSTESIASNSFPSENATNAIGDNGEMSRHWLVFVEKEDNFRPRPSQSVGRRLVAELKSQGDEVCVVEHGDRFEVRTKDHLSINPQVAADYDKAIAASGQSISDIVYLWGLDAPSVESLTTEQLDASSLLTSVAPMYLVQAWERSETQRNARLSMITSGAQSQEGKPEPIEVAQAPLIGFGRVVISEYARLRSKLIDVQPGADFDRSMELLLDELKWRDEEDEVLHRNGRRLVRRFHPQVTQPASYDATNALPHQLQLGKSSGIADMEYRTKPSLALQPNEVEIKVAAVGLNFSDVMKALDLYPGLTGKQVELGAECSGTVSRVGSLVTEWSVGDEVIAVAPGAFSSHVAVDSNLVARKPKGMAHHEAAAIPIAFLTAAFALEDCARLGKGESVLIHSATGGVGMAALQIARNIGAIPFATAGSDEKRTFLKRIFEELFPLDDSSIIPLDDRIMDSRSLAFAEQIQHVTQGMGVDAILNSLPGEAIAKGMGSLAIGGRFLEIGKRDIYGDAPLGLYPMRNNLSFFAIDLDQMFKMKAERMGRMLREIVDRFERGELKVLPTLPFPVDDTANAFRLMQQGKHIGKIVVTMEKPPTKVLPGQHAPIQFDSESTYWIAGGLGGFGLEIARWLVNKGARSIALSGRSQTVSEEAAKVIAELQGLGANVHCFPTDINKLDQVRVTLEKIRALKDPLGRPLPLRGVFHTAMVLEDKLLVDLDLDTLQRVLKPKVLGGWNLHLATLDIELDLFVLFSSLSSIFGHAGQANYSAANSMLDGLAYFRRAHGLPALVMNWGHLGETGYLAKRKQLGERLERQGVLSFTIKQALESLEYAMQIKQIQMSVLRMDWTIWRGLGITSRVSPRFSHLLRQTGTNSLGGGGSLITIDRLRTVEGAERLELAKQALSSKVSTLLGIPQNQLDLDTPLLELGLDSLMAVELRNWIEGQLEVNLPISALMRGGTILNLAGSICDTIDQGLNEPGNGTEASEEMAQGISADKAASLLEQLPEMSDEMVAQLLSQVLSESDKK